MGKFEEYSFFAHFRDFPIILNQNLIFQTISLVIMALCRLAFLLIAWLDGLCKKYDCLLSTFFCENCNPVRAQHGLQVPKKAQKKGPTPEFLNTQCNPETITCMITEYY